MLNKTNQSKLHPASKLHFRFSEIIMLMNKFLRLGKEIIRKHSKLMFSQRILIKYPAVIILLISVITTVIIMLIKMETQH